MFITSVERKLGSCFRCGRIMGISVLRRIEFYEGHLTPGSFHHKTICLACLENADDLTKAMGGKIT